MFEGGVTQGPTDNCAGGGGIVFRCACRDYMHATREAHCPFFTATNESPLWSTPQSCQGILNIVLLQLKQ
jgi:hypothetical protein